MRYLLTTRLLYHAIELLPDIFILAGNIAGVNPMQERQRLEGMFLKLVEC